METQGEDACLQGTLEPPRSSERRGTHSPSRPRMVPALPAPGSQTSGLQKCEAMHLGCLSPPGCGICCGGLGPLTQPGLRKGVLPPSFSVTQPPGPKTGCSRILFCPRLLGHQRGAWPLPQPKSGVGDSSVFPQPPEPPLGHSSSSCPWQPCCSSGRLFLTSLTLETSLSRTGRLGPSRAPSTPIQWRPTFLPSPPPGCPILALFSEPTDLGWGRRAQGKRPG